MPDNQLDNTDNQFLLVADARETDALAQRLKAASGGSPSPTTAPSSSQPLTPEMVAAEAAALKPPEPTWIESIGQVVRHVQGKIGSAIDKIPGARPVFTADTAIGEYLKGLMAGTTKPMTPEQLVEKMAADRVTGPIPEGLTALDLVLQQPGGQAWAAAMHTAAEMITPINLLLGGGPRLLAGARATKTATPEAATTLTPEAIQTPAATRIPGSLTDPLADEMAQRFQTGPDRTIIEPTPAGEVEKTQRVVPPDIIGPTSQGVTQETFGKEFTQGMGDTNVAQDVVAQGRELELKALREQLDVSPDATTKLALETTIGKLERQGANEQRAALQQELEATTDPVKKSDLQKQLTEIEKTYPTVTIKPVSAKTPAEPEAVVIGKQQVSIDFQALQTPEAIDQAKETLWQAQKKAFGGEKAIGEIERGTKPIPIEEAKLLAAWSRTTPEDLIAELRGQQVKMEEIYKNALFLEASQGEAAQAAAAFKAGTLSQDGFLDAVTRYQAIGKATAGKGTDAAQTLRIMREEAIQHPLKRYRAAMRDLEKTGVTVGKDGEIEALADIMINVDKNVFADVMSKPRWTDYLQEFVYFSYLSSPKSHGVNLTGSVFLTPLQAIMERQIAGLLPGEGVRATEALAMGRAWVSTMQNAWRAVADSYRTDGRAGVIDLMDRVSQGQQSKLDRGIMPAFARQNVPEPLRDGWLGSVAQGVGMALRTPTKALQTEDALMRGLNYNMEIAAQAVRETAAKGLTDDAAIKASITDLTINPSAKAELAAQQFAAVQTFTDELSHGGQGLQAFLQEHPLLKVSVAPFVKTPINIAHYYWERTPILNLAAKSLRDDLAAGGARAQLAQAKIVMGAGLAGIGATLASGGIITGKGPSDPDTRKLWLQTHQPYAIKIGEHWVGYNQLDPIAMSLGEAADVVMLMQESQDRALYESVPEALIVANARIITSKTYVQGIAQYLDAIEEAARNPQQTGQIIARREKEHASVIIPGLVSGINKAFFETQQREVNTALESVESRIPGLSATLKPKLDFFGDPILTEGWPVDLVSPVFLKRAKTDPVAEEMVKQKASPSMPPHVIEGMRLTSDEYHDLVHIFGKEATVKGYTLHDGLKALFEDQIGPSYTARTDSSAGGTGKKTLIEDLVTQYRQQAFKLFMESHTDFTQRYLEKLGTTRENLTGERPSSSRLGPVPPRAMPRP